MESSNPFKPKYLLGKIPNKYLILDMIFYSYYKQKSFNFIFQACRSFRQLLKENYEASGLMSEDALSHIKDLPSTITQLDT
jgi:hypothetical protein